jgi:hypothetical protein
MGEYCLVKPTGMA